jgi:hypothetical protein
MGACAIVKMHHAAVVTLSKHMTPHQQNVLDGLQIIARANGFNLIAYTPGQVMTVKIDPTYIDLLQDPDPVERREGVLPRLVEDATHVSVPKPLERKINPDDLPPKLRDLVSNSGLERICGQCGMPLQGGVCFECSISPAGNAEPGGNYGED